MKRILKNRLFTFILGAIIFGGIGVYAATIAASQITYSNTSGLKDANGNNVTNVQGAIDALYSKVSGKINVDWKTGNETYLGIMYFDPVHPKNICDEKNSFSNTGVKNGCMKWYIYKEDRDNYKAILDHNTTALVQWNTYNSNVTLINSNIQPLIDELKQKWVTEEGYVIDVGIMSGQEIATLTGNSLWVADGSWYYLDAGTTNSQTQVAAFRGASAYAWLYDYTYDCEQYGCNVQDNNTYINITNNESSTIAGYWTSTKNSESMAWRVNRFGRFSGGNLNTVGSGLRPVITIPKSALNS